MTRPGLVGAAASIQDARLAVRTAGPGEVVHFEAAWTIALLAAHPEQSASLLAGGLEVAREQGHLAEAVLAYAENGFSVSAAARRAAPSRQLGDLPARALADTHRMEPSHVQRAAPLRGVAAPGPPSRPRVMRMA